MLTRQLSFLDNLPKQEIKPRAVGALVSNKGGLTQALAPAPTIDRFPIVIGQGLSLQYLSSAYRLCTTGWRYLYVDLINELLEHDPHVRGVMRQRLLPVAGASYNVVPASLPEGDPDAELAQDIADEVERQLDNLPSRSQSFGQLTWGAVYGVSGAEVEWERLPGNRVKWEVRRLHNIHSRRLNYTNPGSWDVHVYDMGAAVNTTSPPGSNGNAYWGPTNGPYGLRCATYPGKFIVHAPALNGDYPTRDGEGRYIAFYMAIKRMVVRCTANDYERTIRPMLIAYFNREVDGASKDPIADDEDRAAAQTVLDAFGTGAMNAALVPNSIKFDVVKSLQERSIIEFLEWLDNQLTKACLGQTFTTSPGAHGHRAAADTAKQGTMEIVRYDAQCFADTLERDLVYWIVALNWGSEIAKRLTPKLVAHVEDKADPQTLADVAAKLTSIDVPLDADVLAERCGFKVVPKPEGFEDQPRRTRMNQAGYPPSPDPSIEPTGIDPTPDQPDDIGGAGASAPYWQDGAIVIPPGAMPKPLAKPKPKKPPAAAPGVTGEDAKAKSSGKPPADPTSDPQGDGKSKDDVEVADKDKPSKDKSKDKSDDKGSKSKADKDDDKPSKSSKSDDDEDKPAAKSKSDDKDDDDKPSKSKSKSDDDDKPKGKSKDDDEDKPKLKASKSDKDDDDKKPEPKSKKKDEDEDEKPKSKSKGKDDDDKPAAKKSDKDEDKPSKSKKDDDDEDDKSKAKPKSKAKDDDEDKPKKGETKRKASDDEDAIDLSALGEE